MKARVPWMLVNLSPEAGKIQVRLVPEGCEMKQATSIDITTGDAMAVAQTLIQCAMAALPRHFQRSFNTIPEQDSIKADPHAV